MYCGRFLFGALRILLGYVEVASRREILLYRISVVSRLRIIDIKFIRNIVSAFRVMGSRFYNFILIIHASCDWWEVSRLRVVGFGNVLAYSVTRFPMIPFNPNASIWGNVGTSENA